MKRPLHWVAAAACAAAATLLVLSVTTTADATDQQSVRYLGHRFTVPGGWQVIDLAKNPHACVRFDRHALYLGTPSPDQDCPSKAIGRTEAVLVEPATGAGATGSTDDAVTQQITADAAGVTVTATYDRNPALARKIVRAAGFAAAGTAPARTATAQRAPTAQGAAVVPASVAPGATDYTGKGFDACTAPSASTMNAWLSSPYRAIGVYIGGAQRACAQPNLTAAWVAQQVAAGWHFFPLYVGPQALYNQITSPTAQGISAADDAASQAAALGFGPKTPLYYDMEAYPAAQSSTALAFESAWTTELHARGYTSGYYSSSNSGIADLVANRTSYVMPDILDIANWDDVATTEDTNVPANLWANHQRIHQYTGGITETNGGVSINIDHDYLDVSVWQALAPGSGRTPPVGSGPIPSGRPLPPTATSPRPRR